MTNFPTIFDTSTGHLKPSDHGLLDRFKGDGNTPLLGAPVICYGIDEYGWMVRTDGGRKSNGSEEALEEWRADKVARMKDAGLSDEFVALMLHAWENDAVFLSLDRDAEPTPGFPLFDAVTGEMVDDGEDNTPASTAP